jgi:prepilin-type N-terminal cleavage/methylation domain-containing protein
MTNTKSFSLIELVVTMSVLAVLAWLGFSATLSAVDTWGFLTQRKEILMDGSSAMDRMTREIREVRNSTSVTTANSTTFVFTDSNNSSIVFTINSGVINITENGATNGLLSNATAMAFTYYNSNNTVIATPAVAPSATNIKRVRINITLSKGASRPMYLQSDVWPRNL